MSKVYCECLTPSVSLPKKDYTKDGRWGEFLNLPIVFDISPAGKLNIYDPSVIICHFSFIVTSSAVELRFDWPCENGFNCKPLCENAVKAFGVEEANYKTIATFCPHACPCLQYVRRKEAPDPFTYPFTYLSWSCLNIDAPLRPSEVRCDAWYEMVCMPKK